MRFVSLSRSRCRPVRFASFAATLLTLLAVVLMPLLHSAGSRGTPSPDTSGVHAHVAAIHGMHGTASAADDGPGGTTADALGCLDMAGCPTHSYFVTVLYPITREPVRHALASGREPLLAALVAECERPPPRTQA